MTDKKPLTDDERQVFLDSLPDDQLNNDAEQTFDDTLKRASQPLESTPEKQDSADGYSDRQTHSGTAEDTSHSHSDTSHQSNA
jgi:hypothetical protein